MSRKVHVANGRKAREQRQIVASDARSISEVFTASQKIEELDKRLGVGVGAAKERARLAKEIENV